MQELARPPAATIRLEKIAGGTEGQVLPRLRLLVLQSGLAELLEIETHAAGDVDFGDGHEQWEPVAAVDLPAEVKDDEQRARKPRSEEQFGSQCCTASLSGNDRLVQAGKQADEGQKAADIGAPDTVLRLVGNLIESAAVVLPRAAEANMGPAHRAPNKEVRDTAEREQPIEELGAGARSFADIRQEAESDLDENTPDGTTLLVDVREPLGAHTAGGEGLHCPRAAKGTAVGDGDDGQENDDVEDRRQDGDTGLHD